MYNPFNRQIIKEFLTIEGYTVDEAASGKEAFAMLARKTYLLILMDLLMPGMNGFEVTERIRDMGIVTPIIAQSSLSTREDQRRSMEAGCNAFLPKPINFPDLKNIVKKYISEYSHEKPQKIQKYGFETTDTPTLSIISEHKVLLVEENKIKADHFSEQLGGYGFNVLHVTNGDLAWDVIKEHKRKVDIVISNIFTSSIDGLGLLVKIKSEFSRQPVLIYTEEYDNDTFQLALQLGADGIIPVTKLDDKIVDIIESAIYHSKGKSSYLHNGSISQQVRESQARLIAISEIDKSQYIDLGYLTLHEAGGDSVHYREFNKAGRIGLVIMDVAGHDIGSSYISAIALGILNSIWDLYPDPQELLNHLNSEILKIGGGKYQICTTVVLWDQWRRRIKIATAGSPGGLLLLNSNSGFFKPVELLGGGMCLGMLKRTDLFSNQEIEFVHGSFIFFFSDGITIEQISKAVCNKGLAPESGKIKGTSQKIIDSLNISGQQEDDMILIALESPSCITNTGIHYEFKSKFEDVNQACNWAAEEFNKTGLPDGLDIDFINLCFRETLLNAIEHGNKQNPDSFVDVSLYFNPKELRIDVSDEGSGFDLDEKLAQAEAHNGFQIGKRGLQLMNAVTDKIEVTGGTVTLIFNGNP